MGRAPVLTFLGGARTVTGSKLLLDHDGRRILVDCGLFQGLKELRQRNWSPLPLDGIDAVVLTHAHLDHCGHLPRLVAGGFAGPVYATPGTVALAGIVLPDSGHLQEEEARFANRAGYSRHRPALPLYTEDDAHRALQLLEPLPFRTPREVAPGISVELVPAGHILGSAVVRIRLDGGPTLVCSGDLGRAGHPILVPPDPIGDADHVVVESTYGDRRHEDAGALATLRDAIVRTVERGGTVVIPAFAVDRTEVLLHHLATLHHAGELPDVPVFVDSPMALAALAVYRAAVGAGAPDVRPRPASAPFDLAHVHEVRDVESSKRVTARDAPSIVIAAAGMATGGRVVHHLARRLPDRRHTVVLVGYQAVGTRGRTLAEGATEVKMLGRYVRVRAEIVDLPAFSVHADADELVAWLRTARRPPDTVLVNHGEEAAAQALRARIHDELDGTAVVPAPMERIRLRA